MSDDERIRQAREELARVSDEVGIPVEAWEPSADPEVELYRIRSVISALERLSSSPEWVNSGDSVGVEDVELPDVWAEAEAALKELDRERVARMLCGMAQIAVVREDLDELPVYWRLLPLVIPTLRVTWEPKFSCTWAAPFLGEAADWEVEVMRAMPWPGDRLVERPGANLDRWRP